MSCWLVEPRDPLIARDGRPANNLRFTTTRFPFPSMLAGAARTRMGSENGAFAVPHGKLGELKSVPVHGPLLAELEPETGAVQQWFAPAPRDAVLAKVGGGERVFLRRLQPRRLAAGERLDSLPERGLLPVSVANPGSDKPLPETPAFWTWERFAGWLAQPEDGEVHPQDLGVPDLLREVRTHLALQPGERVGMDGMLFSTSGLRFLHEAEQGKDREERDPEEEEEKKHQLSPRRFALSLRATGGTVDGRALALREETAPLGGERRLARWSPASREWPELPPELLEKVVETRSARLILLTPAFFADGALPAWSGRPWPSLPAVTVTVSAACVGRPEIVSGWDLAAGNDSGTPGRPKPTRRLAGAGSVYFVNVEGSDADVAAWCRSVWLAPVNDPDPKSEPDNQADLDGFGLAALGLWEHS